MRTLLIFLCFIINPAVTIILSVHRSSLDYCLFQFADIFYYSNQLTANQNYYPDLTVIVFNDTDGISKLNFTGTLIKEIPRAFFSATIFLKNPNEKEYNIQMMKLNVDTCNWHRGIFAQLCFDLLSTYLEEESVTFGCPSQKELKVFTVPVPITKDLPFFLLPKKLMLFEAIGIVKDKIQNSRKMTTVFTLKLHGSIEGRT